MSSRWVPMTMSTVPSARPSTTAVGLGVGLEPRQRLARRPGSCAYRSVNVGQVLLDQQRRRHQHRDLLAVLHRLERRAHRDLGLAVADVAADQPVHRDRLLHVGLDLVDRGELVGRLGVRERVLELALPRGVRAERVPGRGLPRAVQPDQLGRDLPDRLAGPALGLRPVRSRRAGAASGASPPTYRVTWSSWSVGTYSRSPGWPRLVARVLEHQVLAGRARPTVRCTIST